MVKKIYLLTTFLHLSTFFVFAQDINRYYKFSFDLLEDSTRRYIQYDQLKIYKKYSYSVRRKTYNIQDTYMYISLNNKKTDSIEFGKNSSVPYYYEIINIDNRLYFQFEKFLYEVEKTKGKIIKKYPLNDSIMLYGQFKHFFLGTDVKTSMKLYSYNVLTHEYKLMYDFRSIKSIRYEHYESISADSDVPMPIISVHSPIIGKNKLFVSVYDEFPLFEYVLDLSTKQIEQIDSTENYRQIGKAIATYCLNLPNYETIKNSIYNNEPFIQSYFLDITDTLAYINQTEIQIKSETKVILQDAFVMNSDYKIIDRVLDRNFSVYSMIYEKDKKKFVIASGKTDSASCYFNIAIKYPLEKIFYNIYYNKEPSDKDLQGFDQYELLLLKNFIYAKYNYKFNNPFYEAYYNTFTFYHNFQTWDSAKKKIPRRKKVDKYFTEADKKNLALILKKIDNK